MTRRPAALAPPAADGCALALGAQRARPWLGAALERPPALSCCGATGSSRLPGWAGGTPEAPSPGFARVFASSSGRSNFATLTGFIGYCGLVAYAVGLLQVGCMAGASPGKAVGWRNF